MIRSAISIDRARLLCFLALDGGQLWLVGCRWAASGCYPRNKSPHARKLIEQGEGPDNVAQSLNVSRRTLYRALADSAAPFSRA
jgi:hypothetical protein